MGSEVPQPAAAQQLLVAEQRVEGLAQQPVVAEQLVVAERRGPRGQVVAATAWPWAPLRSARLAVAELVVAELVVAELGPAVVRPALGVAQTATVGRSWRSG